MPSLPQQDQDRNLATQFLRSIHYQRSAEKETYGDALSILRNIFEASGQQHLLYLVKLRKLWFDKIDNFLAKNAYPRNISVLRQFTINTEFAKEFAKVTVKSDFSQVVEKMYGESFQRSEQLYAKLQKKLKRTLSEEEIEILKHKVRFKPQQTILHLTVYDGSIAQALRFETESYLGIFLRLLPELKLDDIRCHVGDLGQAQYDQHQVSLLAKDWQQITPEEVHQRCMPAFIHRVSRGHAVLVLYVSTAEGFEYLKRTPGADWLVQHLHKMRDDLKEVLQRIAFVPKFELDLEQTRLRSMLQGNSQADGSAVIEKNCSQLKTNFTKSTPGANVQFAKIRKLLE
ncbi:MAG: hypothetical protein H8E38_03430 [SAR324 cluster bacterium]|nr:hypothetical protein [SAR324 cluster bacterium]MBL7035501.1 hypothetical protein [SAR324 cluster bacterium]